MGNNEFLHGTRKHETERKSPKLAPKMNALNQDNLFSKKEKQWIRDKAGGAKTAFLQNIPKFEQHPVPVLIAGEVYGGIWLEHNQDNLFIADYHHEAAWASRQIFMDYQREDGLLPFMFPLQTTWATGSKKPLRCTFYGWKPMVAKKNSANSWVDGSEPSSNTTIDSPKKSTPLPEPRLALEQTTLRA